MIKNIIIFILILAFIAVIVFLDLPEFQEVLSLRKEVKEQKEIFSEKQILLAKIGKLTEDYEGNEEDLKRVNYILPSGQDIPNLIVQLESLSFEAGLVLEALEFFVGEEETISKAKEARVAEGKTPKDYQTLTVNLKLIGDYLAFKNFLKLVEENIRLMDVGSIDFSTQTEEMFQLFNFNLNLNTYYQ